MNKNDLARLLPVPAERDLPADRKQILQEHLMTEFRQASEPRTSEPRTSEPRTSEPRTKTRTRHPAFIAAAVLTAAAVAGVAVAATNVLSAPPAKPSAHALPAKPAKHTEPSKQAEPAIQLPNTPAAQLLVKIADAAASRPAPVVRDSDFTYIRSDVADTTDIITNHDIPGLPGFHEREIWSPVANLCVPGLLIEGGRTPLAGGPGKCPTEGNIADPTYRFLQSMPTQPGALLAFLRAGLKGTNEVVGEEINDIILESILPPGLASAMYRLAATLPGTSLDRHTTTVTGKPGIGILFKHKHQYQQEWVFDPHTLQFIGFSSLDPTTGKAVGGITIVQRAFVAKAGERP